MTIQKKKPAEQQAVDYLAVIDMETFVRRTTVLLNAIIARAIKLGYIIRFENLGDGMFELEMPPVRGQQQLFGGKIFSLLHWAEGFMTNLLGLHPGETGNKLYHHLQCDCEECEGSLQHLITMIESQPIPSYTEALRQAAVQAAAHQQIKPISVIKTHKKH